MVRTFIIATTAVAALFSSAAFTQGPGPGTASIPDFSGVWTREYTGVEPPLSGPGPVRNPLFRSGVPEAYQIVGDHTNPILKPGAAEVVKKHGEIELSGMPVPSPRNQCWPEGVPAVFNDVGILMFQQPDKVTGLAVWPENVCAENVRAPFVAKDSAVPRTDKPDF